MKVLIAGDFCQRHRIDKIIKKKGYDSLFESVKPIINSCDIRIVNFEFPIAFKGHEMPIDKIGPILKGTENAVDAIKNAGFNVCTLANNHILDQGYYCCIKTKQILEDNNIITVGVGNNIREASLPKYINISGKTLAIINCCEHEFSIANENSPGANPINPIQQFYTIKEAKKKSDYIIVITHSGIEHFQLPTPRMVENYRFYIDVGADAVINHHQHCFSGYEIYRGKPIFYGLGNFLFDSPSTTHGIWNEGFMLELEFTSSIKYKLYPYNQCNEKPNIELLDQKERLLFDKRILELNNIILSPNKLIKAMDSYASLHRKYILSSFTPWNNKLFKSAYIRGMIPSFLSKKQKLNIINRISCESHYDLTLNELKRL